MLLNQLLTACGLSVFSEDIEITGITADSRKVEKGFLFAALPGVKADGVDFLPQAVENGAVAAIFPKEAKVPDLPVIGIPIHTKSVGGVDSLYSIVQMPSGIPVATVAIDGSTNAALLAAEMLAISDDELHQKLKDYRAKMKDGVIKKAEKLDKLGAKAYIEQM